MGSEAPGSVALDQRSDSQLMWPGQCEHVSAIPPPGCIAHTVRVGLSWLGEPTVAALRVALRAVEPDLADGTIVPRGLEPSDDPRGCKASAVVGGRFVVSLGLSSRCPTGNTVRSVKLALAGVIVANTPQRSLIRNVWRFRYHSTGNDKHLFDLDGHIGKYRAERALRAATAGP